MALPATEKLFSSAAIKMYDFDPDSADAVDIAWVDMRDYENFACAFFRTIGTGALDTFKILANTASDGSGTDRVIKTHAVASEPNALGDQIFLECSAEEIAQTGADNSEDLRYVTASVEFATSTDEGVVLYERFNPRFAKTGLTADIVA